MKTKFILALDQGTTSSKALLFDRNGKCCASAQKEYKQIYPRAGWVEHNPLDIWSTQMAVASEVIAKLGILPASIAGIGICNQRETTIVWDRKTGKPIYNAIVWQDHRTADFCDQLKSDGYGTMVKEKTGLEIDAYFSATKIKWLLDNITGARKKAESGQLAFGTVDSWLIWNLTQGRSHLTDITNASRTLLFNIKTLKWDKDLLRLFGIPEKLLPKVKPNSTVFARTAGHVLKAKIPISGVAGDQQAALFGQMCFEKGMVKNTYGTGCFLMMNTGEDPVLSNHKLLTTIAWQLDGETKYALEGSVFVGGAVIQWLRDGLNFFRETKEVERLASEVDDNGGVYFIPAFTGLGAPWWRQKAKGLIYGITRGTTKANITRAALESIAFQSQAVMEAMEKDTGLCIQNLRVDGGAVENDLLMQFQSDILGMKVERPRMQETTALGAAYFAGLAIGFWKNMDEISSQWLQGKEFTPKIPEPQARQRTREWQEVVKKAF
ncbi:MAG: glycerol kinase GlpK [Bacteroidales bacterium]|nr:glycerol kinase GlpK [Bacteroidales bacterium]